MIHCKKKLSLHFCQGKSLSVLIKLIKPYNNKTTIL